MQQRSSRRMRWLVPALGGVLLLGSAACDNNGTNVLVRVATDLTLTSGNAQDGAVGQPLAQPIVVHVADQNGIAFAGVVVDWTVTSGGGSVSSATSTSDINGNASIIWTMGAAAGAASLQASISTGPSVTATANAFVP